MFTCGIEARGFAVKDLLYFVSMKHVRYTNVLENPAGLCSAEMKVIDGLAYCGQKFHGTR